MCAYSGVSQEIGGSMANSLSKDYLNRWQDDISGIIIIVGTNGWALPLVPSNRFDLKC